jgi:hypothetical protein
MTALGPWTVPDGDPLLSRAQTALPLLRPKVIDAFKPGQIVLQSTFRPRQAPVWAWGFTPTRTETWVANNHPYVIAEYTCNHELAHTFDPLFLTAADRKVLMQKMGLVVSGTTDAQINLQWRRGSYTSHACYVPREGFADCFAKAQAQAPGAPQDPATNGFRNVLPHFYKIGIAPADFPWFLEFLKGIVP